jgi:hypothetical protein
MRASLRVLPNRFFFWVVFALSSCRLLPAQGSPASNPGPLDDQAVVAIGPTVHEASISSASPLLEKIPVGPACAIVSLCYGACETPSCSCSCDSCSNCSNCTCS